MDPSACRLYVYLAQTASLGVILRRGPSDWAHLSLWHTDTDRIEPGQWLRGRIYERRCDLSPDGSLWAYFAYNHRAIHDIGTESYAALSRPPWFTALAVWGIGSTYFAGGYFVDDQTLFLGGIAGETAPDRGQISPGLHLTRQGLPMVDRSPNWTDRTLYCSRLLRAGWQPLSSIEDPNALWQRVHPNGDDALIMAPAPPSCGSSAGYPEYMLHRGSEMRPLGLATWADWDQRGRLVVAQAGRLLEFSRQGTPIREITDLNPLRPDPQPAPAWAITWPRG